MSKVITIAQQKGGAGKTTLAAHLAVVWSQRGMKVAVVDTDPQASLTEWHKIREEKFGEEYTGLTFMTLSGWRVGSEISRLKRNFDIVVIDSPPHTETDARTAIRNADLVVIPVQPSPTDLWATKATIDIAKAERVPSMVVMNRVPANSKLAAEIVKKLDSIAKSTFGNRVGFAASLMEGKTITELAPKSPAAEEVKALSKEILSKFKPEKAEDEDEQEAPKQRRKVLEDA
jgi:chromosome partitioning protein